ncbi:MAG: hypothetical protein U0350_42740 [Caldilineaceae bacterium]
MFDYSLPGGLPAGSRTAWSRLPLQPLTETGLTPFSYSVLAEIAGRAWYQYFDQLGFDPMPKARVLRQFQGRPYLNLTISAQREAEHAALEPFTLRLDGQWFPLCKWEKPGLLAGFKASLNQKKIDDTLKQLNGEIDAVTQKAQSWWAKTQGWRWTQAEILQIMEEIEQAATPSFLSFFVARYNLEVALNRLFRYTVDKMAYPTNLAALQTIIDDRAHAPVEQDVYERLAVLVNLFIGDPSAMVWLKSGAFVRWQETLPNSQLTTALNEFLKRYGHRRLGLKQQKAGYTGEGELGAPRWHEDPTPLFSQMLAYPASSGQAGAALSATQSEQQILAAVEAGRRKEATALLQKIHQCLALQSRALHAFAYILDGTRRWALAAAREAMLDQRLLGEDEVFFFELEEIKQMMTGEWNVSDKSEIQSAYARRKAEYTQWQEASSTALLIGDTAAISRHA